MDREYEFRQRLDSLGFGSIFHLVAETGIVRCLFIWNSMDHGALCAGIGCGNSISTAIITALYCYNRRVNYYFWQQDPGHGQYAGLYWPTFRA